MDDATKQRWGQLTSHEQRAILDKHTDYNIYHDWWDCEVEWFCDQMDRLGMYVSPKNVQFSVGSYDDHCAFEGEVYDWKEFLTNRGYDDPLLHELARDHWVFQVSPSGYRHPIMNTTYRTQTPLINPYTGEDITYPDGTNDFEDDPGAMLRAAVWDVAMEKYAAIDFEKEFLACFRDKADDLRRLLSDEYEYLNSDEAILESLYDNDRLDELIDAALAERETEEIGA